MPRFQKKASYYAPNREKDVVLECGCIDTWAFAIRILGTGEGKWWQICPKGHTGSGRYGLNRILREATVYESIQFYERGIPAPKRRSNRAPKWMRDVPGKSQAKTDRQPTGEQSALF